MWSPNLWTFKESTSDGRDTYNYISFYETIYIEGNNKKKWQSKLLAMLCKDCSKMVRHMGIS